MTKEELFEQIDSLKKAYGSIRSIDPEGPAYKKLKSLVNEMDNELVVIVRDAKIKFMSNVAWWVCERRGLNKD